MSIQTRVIHDVCGSEAKVIFERKESASPERLMNMGGTSTRFIYAYCERCHALGEIVTNGAGGRESWERIDQPKAAGAQ